jgi:hypothetical protein
VRGEQRGEEGAARLPPAASEQREREREREREAAVV